MTPADEYMPAEAQKYAADKNLNKAYKNGYKNGYSKATKYASSSSSSSSYVNGKKGNSIIL